MKTKNQHLKEMFREQKTGHTPTPWTFGHNTKSGFDTETLIYSDNERATFVAAVLETPEGKKNAEFIVRAVNSHEKLVSLVKRYKFALPHDPRITTEGMLQIMKEIDDAIAQAEGK